MASKLDRMRSNPAGNWKIGDVEDICARFGMGCQPPCGGGSHYKIFHPSLREILTIPSAKPIKPVYIRKPVRYLERIGGPDGKA